MSPGRGISAAVRANGELRLRPVFTPHDFGKNFMHRNKPEMQIRREAALNIFFRLVALISIVQESNLKKMLHLFSRGYLATANG